MVDVILYNDINLLYIVIQYFFSGKSVDRITRWEYVIQQIPEKLMHFIKLMAKSNENPLVAQSSPAHWLQHCVQQPKTLADIKVIATHVMNS